MSLMGTLAKVAIGIAVAKGAQAVLKGGSGGTSTRGSGGGLGDILEQLGKSGPAKTGSQGSVIDDVLGQLTGRQGSAPRGSPGGSPGDIFKEFTKGKHESGEDLDDPFSGRSGNQSAGRRGGPGSEGGFGDVLDDYLRRGGETKYQPTPQQEAMAALMLRASIQAAKSDGRLDENERDRLLKVLGDVSDEERRFVENEMQRPVDVENLARQVPDGLEPQIYAISLTTIDLDRQSEAQYLHELATAMGLSHSRVNAIHDKLGVQRIYS